MDDKSPTPAEENAGSTDEKPTFDNHDELMNHVDASLEQHKSKKPHKPIVMAAVAAIVLLAGLIGVLLTMDSSDDTANNEEPVVEQQTPVTTLGASLATIEGNVQISSDGDAWTDAEGGESLANLDYVRTLADSRAIILMDDGSIVRLDGNTEIYLSSLEADSLEVTLVDGQVYSRVVESENQTFTVVTANERFEALGTAYKTSTDGTKDNLEVYESKVKVLSADIEIGEGNKYDTDSKEKSEIDLASLSDDEFAQWNKDKDSANDEFKNKLGVLGQEVKDENESTPAPVVDSSASITLSGSKSSNGVSLSWSLSNVSAPKGFKVVRDKSTSNPQYGVHSAQYVGSGNSHTWYDDNGGTYYYRVCVYTGSGCSVYSNSIQVESPFVEKSPVESGSINLNISGNVLTWGLVGGSAPHGYKVVLSSSTGPVYPEHSIKYVAAGTTGVELPEKSAGTYYVRVCKYTNGTQEAGCVDYSNEVEYVVL